MTKSWLLFARNRSPIGKCLVWLSGCYLLAFQRFLKYEVGFGVPKIYYSCDSLYVIIHTIATGSEMMLTFFHYVYTGWGSMVATGFDLLLIIWLLLAWLESTKSKAERLSKSGGGAQKGGLFV